jgi:hypothetical protein
VFRAILELLITLLVVMVIRSVISGFLKVAAGAQSKQPSSGSSSRPEPQIRGELHRDPVCGTFVAESTAFRRQAGQQMFYYCSDACREKHALVVR